MTAGAAPWRVLICHAPDDEAAFRISQAAIDAAIGRAGPEPPLIEARELELGDPGMAQALSWAQILVGWQLPLDLVATHGQALRLVQLINAGVDNIYPFDWLPNGAALCNARGIHAARLQEWATMVLLMLHARMPFFATAQRAHRWCRRPTSCIAGTSAVVFGTGALGGAVGRAARGLKIGTTGIRRNPAPAEGFDRVVGFTDTAPALEKADFVVFALPLTPQTRGIGSAAFFGRLRPGAGFANFGRGALVDQSAMVEALERGVLGGAVIDVATPEPLPPDSPLWSAPNLIVTPHVSCDDPATYIPDALDVLMDNLGRLGAGRALRNRVDLNLAY